MRLCRFHLPPLGPRLGLLAGGRVLDLTAADPEAFTSLSAALDLPDLAVRLKRLGPRLEAAGGPDLAALAVPPDPAKPHLLAPIDAQEVWAAGVTYERSRDARLVESKTSPTVYDQVYHAVRPEIFFKATPRRVSGHLAPLRIRRDSAWNVPEPELALALNSRLELVGYCVGNDMSSRDIEGENPVYLPQAKIYNQCCGLGPWLTLADRTIDPRALEVRLTIRREGQTVFEDQTTTARIRRPFEELVAYLGRDNDLPQGAFLLTGTGIVPPPEFTLHSGDEVRVAIEELGELVNPIVQGG